MNLMPSQSSMIGLLPQRRYTRQFLHSCIRTWRLQTTRVLCSTPVTCAAPLVLPQIRRLSVTESMASVANGFDNELDRSTALW